MRYLFVAFALLMTPSASNAAPPVRVVSMNLCTDQLAMLLAAPGQLVSVSSWAARPTASNMVEATQGLKLNNARAEEIFLLEPDLVLAGTFSNPVTVDMLTRLGVDVASMAPADSLAAIFANIESVGVLLGREAQAKALAVELEAALEAQAARVAGMLPKDAAYHYANNFTAGAGTLADDVMVRAGFTNAAATLGLRGAARLTLEQLVMAQPFLIRSQTIAGGSTGRAYETGRHPALIALTTEGRMAEVADRWQTCGTPFVVEALRVLVDARLRLEGE